MNLPYSHTHHDTNVMPDKHSTGLIDESKLRIHTECTDVFPITIPSHGAIRLTASQMLNQNGYFENVYFDGAYLYPKSSPSEEFYVTFKNCYFKGEYENDDGTTSHAIGMCQGNSGFMYHYTFINCVFDGYANASTTYSKGDTFINCRSVNMWQDNLKLGPNTRIVNCYAALAGKESGSHADSIQWSGGSPSFSIDGLRMDNLSLSPTTYANCCLYIDHETGTNYDLNVPDGSAKNLWANGGGYTYWIRHSGDAYSVSHFNLQNAWYGCTHTYGAVSGGASDKLSFKDTNEITTAIVSSVWVEADGVHLLATNYTNQDRSIIVRTNNGSYNFTIGKHPINSELSEYTWDTLPIDVEYVVPEADYIVCYDTSESAENQIRFVDFSEPVVALIDSLSVKGIIANIYDETAFHSEDVVTSISEASDENHIPTAKAVIEFLNSLT